MVKASYLLLLGCAAAASARADDERVVHPHYTFRTERSDEVAGSLSLAHGSFEFLGDDERLVLEGRCSTS